MLFPSLLKIIPVQYLFDGEGRGNDKAQDEKHTFIPMDLLLWKIHVWGL